MTAQPEISFNALVVSLATSAAVHFGDAAMVGFANMGDPPCLAAETCQNRRKEIVSATRERCVSVNERRQMQNVAQV